MPATSRAGNPHQQIRFCRAPDGVRIAYAVHGGGPPILISTCWLSHLQHDWASPVWRHFLEDIGRFATIIRFDERGHGLSDWDVTDFSLEARVGDLTAVADDAGFDTFALMAMAQGGPVAISYAHRNPDRVTRLVFYDSYADPQHGITDDDLELEDAFEHIIKAGWGRPEGTFRRVFSTQMIPDATEEQLGWLDDLLKVSVSPRTAVLARQQRKWADASALMPELAMPALVLHSLRDRMNNFDHARHLSTGIPGARLVPLDSGNHILLAGEPAWPVFVAEVRDFLADDRVTETARKVPLSQILSGRELEVLGLAADGRDNEEIAHTLSLSIRTVERHLQNIYAKLDLQGKAARTAAVARLLGAP
ncbi:alpha/beta fold hydrolase [Nakamurella sp.]|uniref:alpha/beta fold hydrolase n=1 Tax=Nakamurella sp. TaxID=1869182 RepID=UPI0037844E99